MKISFRIETRFRSMYRQSYFSGDFSTYTLKYANKTSYFPNNLYFGHNERRFHSEFSFKSEISIQVYMIPNRHFIPDWVFNPEWKMEWTRSGMSCNLIRIHVNKYKGRFPLRKIVLGSDRIGTKFNLLMCLQCQFPVGLR